MTDPDNTIPDAGPEPAKAARGAAARGAGWKHTEESRRKMSEAQKAAHARRRGERSSDKAPSSRNAGAAKRAERRAGEIAQIRDGLAELLQLPVFPAMIKGDKWAVDHFSARGPALAERIASEAERSEAVRKWALGLVKGSGVTMLAVEAFVYVVPALMHYGLVPGAAGLGIPVVRKRGGEQAERPEAGVRPSFIGRQQGPAERAPEPGPISAEGEIEDALERWAVQDKQRLDRIEDDLEAELSSEDGAVPPLPIEPA